MKVFELVIATERKIIYKGKSSYCGVTTLSGAIGFEADHEPFAAILRPGTEIVFDRMDKGRDSLTIEDGTVVFRDNRCVLTVGS